MSMTEYFETALELAILIVCWIIVGSIIVGAFAAIAIIFLVIAAITIPIAILMKLFEIVCSCICYVVDKTKSHN